MIETGAIRKLWRGFLFAFHSNYGCICNCFGNIQRQRMALPRNLGLGSFKVIENGAVRQTMYDFLLVRHRNYSSLVPFASYLTLNNIVTLKSGLGFVQAH